MANGGSFKSIDPGNVRQTRFYAHKLWEVNRFNIDEYGVQIEFGRKCTGDFATYNNYPTNSSGVTQGSLWDWANCVYYTPSIDTPGYCGDWGIGTTIIRPTNEFSYIGIPQSIFGEYIVPGTVELNYANITLRDNSSGDLYDVSSSQTVGNIFYHNGDLIIANQAYCHSFTGSGLSYLQFKSSCPIETLEVMCSTNPSEFITTTNHTAYNTTSSLNRPGLLRDSLTSSWDPYITTVGLYNEQYVCVAMARLAKPIVKSSNLASTIIVQIDY